MTRSIHISWKQVLRLAVIAILAVAFVLAVTARDAYAAQEKNVPFEEYIYGVDNGIALMDNMMVLDLEDICADDSDMAAQYRKGMDFKAYTKTVGDSTDLDRDFYDSETGVINFLISAPLYCSGNKFRFYIEMGDWTFYSNEITLLYNIKMANYTELQDKTYNGKPQTQDVEVSLDFFGQKIVLKEGVDYTVSYSNNTDAGTASVTYTAVEGPSLGGECTKTFTIKKAAGTMKAKGKTVKVKYSALKKKKQTIKAAKAFTVSKKIGKVTYKKLSGNKKISVSKAGKVTVKKGLKKGIYTVKVRVTDAGNRNYLKKTQTVTLKVKVK